MLHLRNMANRRVISKCVSFFAKFAPPFPLTWRTTFRRRKRRMLIVASPIWARDPFCVVFDLLRVSVATLDASGPMLTMRWENTLAENGRWHVAPRCLCTLGLSSPPHDPCRILHQAGGGDLCWANVPSFRSPPSGAGDAGGFNWCLSVFHTSAKSDGRTQGRQVQDAHISPRQLATLFAVNVAPEATRTPSWTNLTCEPGFCAFSGLRELFRTTSSRCDRAPRLDICSWIGVHSLSSQVSENQILFLLTL